LHVLYQCLCIDRNPETNPRWKTCEPVLNPLHRKSGQVRPHAPNLCVLRKGNLLKEEIREQGSQMQRGRRTDGSAVMMGGDWYIVRLGQRRYPANLQDPINSHVWPDYVHNPLTKKVEKPGALAQMFAECNWGDKCFSELP